MTQQQAMSPHSAKSIVCLLVIIVTISLLTERRSPQQFKEYDNSPLNLITRKGRHLNYFAAIKKENNPEIR